jgi:RNA polymerase sigma factor (sigma-70 family)
MADDALKAIFMASRPALLRFLAVRGAASEDAEDILQNLYLKLDMTVAVPISEPRAYLYRMADNLLLDQRRSGLRRMKRDEQWAASRGDTDGEQDARPTPEDIVIARSQLAIVTAALATLPPRTVEIFRRFRIEGERQTAIADGLGISVSAVEKHLQRAYVVILSSKSDLDAANPHLRRLDDEREMNDR